MFGLGQKYKTLNIASNEEVANNISFLKANRCYLECLAEESIMYLSISNISIPPWAHPRAFEYFYFQRSNSPPPGPKRCSNAPHVRPVRWMGKCPTPGPFF